MNAPFGNTNDDMNDLNRLNFYAEQASLFARNNPTNVQAQPQALWWAERRAAVLLQLQQAQGLPQPPLATAAGAQGAEATGRDCGGAEGTGSDGSAA